MAEARVKIRRGTIGSRGGGGGQWATSEQRPSQSSSNRAAMDHRNAATTFSSLSSSQSVSFSLLLTFLNRKPAIVKTANLLTTIWVFFAFYRPPSSQKNQTFMDMLKSAKVAQDDDDDDEEEFVLKKEPSPHLNSISPPILLFAVASLLVCFSIAGVKSD